MWTVCPVTFEKEIGFTCSLNKAWECVVEGYWVKWYKREHEKYRSSVCERGVYNCVYTVHGMVNGIWKADCKESAKGQESRGK